MSANVEPNTIKTLKIKNILISQPQPASLEKSPFYELAKNYNVELTFRPFMRIEGVSLKDFRSQRTEILDYSAVIFTSRTTIDNFFRICEEARITVPETMKYICSTEAGHVALTIRAPLLLSFSSMSRETPWERTMMQSPGPGLLPSSSQ